MVLAWGEPTSSPLWAGRDDGYAYVCRHYVCRAPATSPAELARGLDDELARGRAATGTPMTAHAELGASGHSEDDGPARRRQRGEGSAARAEPGHAPVHGARLHAGGHHRRRPRHRRDRAPARRLG